MRDWQPGTNRDAGFVLNPTQNWQAGTTSSREHLRQVRLGNCDLASKPALIRVSIDPDSETFAASHDVPPAWHIAKVLSSVLRDNFYRYAKRHYGTHVHPLHADTQSRSFVG